MVESGVHARNNDSDNTVVSLQSISAESSEDEPLAQSLPNTKRKRQKSSSSSKNDSDDANDKSAKVCCEVIHHNYYNSVVYTLYIFVSMMRGKSGNVMEGQYVGE